MKHGSNHVKFFQHHGHGFSLINRCLAATAGFGIIGQRPFQLVGQAQVVDNQPARLVFKHPVDAGNGLHQAVAPHRLVDVHRMQRRAVEPRQPHIPHDHHLHRIARVFEPLGHGLTSQLAANMGLPFSAIRCGTGHDDLQHAFVIVLAMPIRP